MISTIDPEPAKGLEWPSWRTRLLTLRRVAGCLATVVVLLAVTVLVAGWIFDVVAVRRLRPDLPGMAISTALGLAACGLCVILEVALPRSFRRNYRPLVGFMALAFATIDLGLLMGVSGRGVDQLVFGFPDARAEIYMSPATAICLALAGGCLLVRRRRAAVLNGDLFSGLAGVGLFITVLTLTGYAFDSRALHAVFVFSAMALHTATGFFLLFLALLLAHPAWGWMRIAIGVGPGSRILRRNLPFVLLGPFVFCWATLVAVDSGVFDANFRLSVLAISSAACLVGLLFWSALRENADAKVLLATNERLRRALSDRNVLLQEVYHRVKNNLQFIDAMLALESTGEESEAVARRFSTIRGRLHALSLVHQRLVASEDLATLDLKAFLEELCDNQAKGAGLDLRDAKIEAKVAPLRVHFESAVPIGLLVTELISNAAKHAFPNGGHDGVVSVVAMPRGDDALLLAVHDNGVGRAAETEGRDGSDTEEKVGEMILQSLVAQLGAEMTTRYDNGRQVELMIPLRAAVEE